MNKLFDFVLYVFGFWAVWRLFDYCLCRFLPKLKFCKCDKPNDSLVGPVPSGKPMPAPSPAPAPTPKPKPLTNQELDSRLISRLNMATESALVSMPGIGPKRARKIVRARPFRTIQQIQEILPHKIFEGARRNFLE